MSDKGGLVRIEREVAISEVGADEETSLARKVVETILPATALPYLTNSEVERLRAWMPNMLERAIMMRGARGCSPPKADLIVSDDGFLEVVWDRDED